MGRNIATHIAKPPLVRLSNATFFRNNPSTSSIESNTPLFAGTNFDIWPRNTSTEYWAVVGPAGSGKTTFLEILKGNHLCDPPLARSFPYLPQVGAIKRVFDPRILRNRDASKAIRYAGFGGKGSKLAGVETRGSYMSARYESRHEAGDFSLRDYLLGNTDANPADNHKSLLSQKADASRLKRITKELQLEPMLDLPALVLSNGQIRRARIAKAFMEFPLLLLLDEPFLGIDPIHHRILSPALWVLSRRSGPNILLTLGNDQVPPRWITHLMCLENCQLRFSGPKDLVYEEALAAGYPLATAGLKRSLWRGVGEQDGEDMDPTYTEDHEDVVDDDLEIQGVESTSVPQTVEESGNISLHQGEVASVFQDMNVKDSSSGTRRPKYTNRWDVQRDITETLTIGEPVIEMKGVQVSYGKLTALGDWTEPGQQDPGLFWTIKRGERWGIFGPNGSGKTTILSLVNSDHPKSYSQSISYFGRSRLPEPGQPGISIFDLQSKIMQASPEVHAFFPKHLSIRATLENAWADTFLSKPRLTHQIDSIVDSTLRWFEKELNPRCADVDPIVGLSDYAHKPRRKGEDRVTIYHERRLEWADTVRLSEVSFAAQRVALFLRAVIKKPDLVILDEAFSGMDKNTRAKCMMFLAYGETKSIGPSRHGQEAEIRDADTLNKFTTPIVDAGLVKIGPFESRQALVVVAHEQDEVPPLVDRYIFLEEPGTKRPPRIGEIPVEDEYRINQRTSWWKKMWNPSVAATNKDKFNRSYDPAKSLRR